MSDSDSFIDEVSEELQRDRLFGFLRRYGWIAIVAVLALVGAAAWSEYSKARNQAAAQELGDALLAQLEPSDEDTDRAAAIAGLADQAPTPEAQAILALIASAEQSGAEGADDAAREAAATRLEQLAATADLRPVYRDLALLKALMLRGDGLEPQARLTQLAPLAVPGAPYRLIAQEQMALAEISAGQTSEALDRLRAIENDASASDDIRRRVGLLITALGGRADKA